ncbi:MAG: hypothetical protein IPQ09_08535 [Myxococcales bacterium]|nr:hypothetical protein [Myxococcales bacterium]
MSDGIFFGLVSAFAITHAAPLAGAVYLREEAKTRPTWQTFRKAPEVLDRSAYRSGGPVFTGHLRARAGVVRLAALSRFVMGSMFLPGSRGRSLGLVAMGGAPQHPGARPRGVALAVGVQAAPLRSRRGGVGRARGGRVVLLQRAARARLGDGARPRLARARPARAVRRRAYALLSIGQAILLAVAAREVGRQCGDVSEDQVSQGLPPALRTLLDRRRARQAREAGLVTE